jgi:hypothetical protein
MAKKKPLPDPIDVQVTNGGSIFLFQPYTDEAKAWIKNNVSEESQWFGFSLAVEARYAQDLAQGMIDAGLTVR